MTSKLRILAISLVFPVVLAVSVMGFAATKNLEPPDKELLRMMDLLREMEIIKQAEMTRDLSPIEETGDSTSKTPLRKPSPSTRKEATK